MKNISVKVSTTIFSFLLLSAPVFVFAQIANPLGDITITGFVTKVLSYIVKVGSVVAVFAFLYSGFLLVKAQGNEKELETARGAFLNTCIGTLVLLGAQLLATIIEGTVTTLKTGV